MNPNVKWCSERFDPSRFIMIISYRVDVGCVQTSPISFVSRGKGARESKEPENVGGISTSFAVSHHQSQGACMNCE